MTILAAQLQPSWQALTQELGLPESQSTPVFADLCERYSAPDRFYHTLEHIARMLQTLPMENVPALRLAAWFHDAVYDTRAKDNEAQSAKLAREVLMDWTIPAGTIASMERLILATQTHEVDASDTDGASFLDADLEILGSDPAEYARYSDAIRQEYAWVPDESYRTGRAQVLTRFLTRPRIYRTQSMHAALEERARDNLRREIERLQP